MRIRSVVAALLSAVLAAGPLESVAASAAGAKPGSSPTRRAPSVLPFIEDDLDRALAEAKQRDLPLFIESWAPW
jgi:hypothetical protein